jgi:class 3 adenylate cyclase/DNA-binding CsgD family transcriptional regulator
VICPTCYASNIEDARFCEQCGQSLETCCPACGNLARAGARFCRQCGQSLLPPPEPDSPAAASATSPPYPPVLDEKLDRLQRYLPQHLTEKILASQGRLEGERKLVTVLFATLANYTALGERLGEEVLFALMDEVYELFIHEVHRYEGTVNELTGNGIVAFFGAPLAVEQAPQRAVHAALALQRSVARFNTKLEEEREVCLQIRVGINTGPVIVGTVGNNLRMDYKAVGDTVNLASHLEQTAAPGTIQITTQTYRQVAGYFQCDDLGLVSLKGKTMKMRVYRVTGERDVRSRLDVACEHGLTRLVGREHELALLRQSFERARQGQGQAVSIVGDMGLGKSRLLYEFRQSLAGVNHTFLEGRCSPYGTAVAYLPIIDLLQQHFRLEPHASATDIAGRVRRGLAVLGLDVETITPFLLHLLAAEVKGGMLAQMPPETLKHKLFETLLLLALKGAERRPLVLAIEDLHWVDRTTEEFITFLLEHIAGARVLLICTHRPEFVSTWSRRSYHSVSTLTRLVPQEGYQMLTALLGTVQVQETLCTLVLDKAEGVPFFLEELVKSLQETDAIEQHGGQWQLTAEAAAVYMPDTVEEVLMARIDRLPEGAKGVLQIGAVIGREFRCEVLQVVTGLAEEDLLVHLSALTDAELVYERGVPPQTTYLFKHAFTQEAAYCSLLTTRRRELHQRVALALESLFVERLEEHYGQLAHHFFEAAQSDEVDKTIDYAVRAGARAMALAAYTEAVRFYHMTLQTLERQEPVDDTQRCTLLLALGEAQRKAGKALQALDTLQHATDTARRLGAAEHFAHAALEFAQTTWRGWFPAATAVHLLEEAQRMLSDADSVLRAKTLGSLARALLYAGAQKEASECAQQMVEAARRVGEQAVEVARHVGDPGALAFNLGVMFNFPSPPTETEAQLAYATEMLQCAKEAGSSELVIDAHSRRLVCLLELGNIEAADAELNAILRLDDVLRQPAYLRTTTGVRAMRALLAGNFIEAERLSLESATIGQHSHDEGIAGSFGVQMFTLRREQGRLKETESAVRHFVQQHGAALTWRPGLMLIYSELGYKREARAAFEHLAQHDFADLPHDSLWVGCMTYLAEVCAFLGDVDRAATLYQLLLPYAGRAIVIGGGVVCYGAASRYLGLLATTMLRWRAAAQHFEDALAMNARMGARLWLAHTQHEYAQMLLARNQPGDHEQAEALLDQALVTARELGMHTLEERITACSDQMAAPSPTTPSLVPSPYFSELSQREVEVLHLLAAGKSNRDIADTLYISLSTVATHVRNILGKTGSANRTEAAAYALQQGLVQE